MSQGKPIVTRALVAQGGTTLDDPRAFVEQEHTLSPMRPRDLLVRVEAVSINPVDTKTRNSLRAGSSRVLGWDASGVVEAVGPEVQGFAPGDEVWYAGDISRDGTNAELHLVDERIVARKPSTLSHADAAALPLTAITAWETLFERFALSGRSAGTLVVLGGAGGVGSIMIQLAKKLTQVQVVATASRDESRAWVLALGADHVVGHHDLASGVLAVAPGGVEWVFSPHSRGNIPQFATMLKPFGEVTAIDEPSGLDLLPLKSKSIAWHWELMFTRALYETPDMHKQGDLLRQLAQLVDDHTVGTTATTVLDGFAGDTLREAHKLVDSGRSVGKVVVAR
ncbi:zinc-binding alcohol dehydrogenase family protein [Herbiconiux moechotypicola]|uniref:Zinc-type alcohol dehydrogenase-like protein n=1 Tax=Herbiconiux moechotypicola TaxID=637393 RepID=A0ABN3DF72_9MICO|nr:zinc-binding alcohol dehydrogenase family protein [Herbiconiux moechotypicola]MCS5729304.1 zinc-binding alcohol dehydrogenase family protein [Herbiconiux moechotypicola]